MPRTSNRREGVRLGSEVEGLSISTRVFPIIVINGTTRAFPMVKYLCLSVMPVLVQLSGKPLSLSHSTGVSVL